MFDLVYEFQILKGYDSSAVNVLNILRKILFN